MSAHTPSPWEVVLDDDGLTDTVTLVVRMGSHLGGRNGWEPQHRIDYDVDVSARESSPAQFAEAEANARLIAAAPDLYDALREVSILIESGLFKHYEKEPWIDRVRAALTKVEKTP